MNTAKETAVKTVKEPAETVKAEDKAIELKPGNGDYAVQSNVPAIIETLERRVAELEAFAVKVRQKMHFADQEVTIPPRRNYNPDYLPHSVEGIVSYHDNPKKE
jgi:hypothetical protein